MKKKEKLLFGGAQANMQRLSVGVLASSYSTLLSLFRLIELILLWWNANDRGSPLTLERGPSAYMYEQQQSLL